MRINRPKKNKKLRYLVWSNNDPNDSFEVDAIDVNEAAWAALDELGWSVSAEPYDNPDLED